VPRLSRIVYQGKFYAYPLSFFNTLRNLGIVESVLISLSYLKARLWPLPEEENFEQWVVNRFGWRLYRTFFKTYTEKVWGIPCHTIQADWAAQRIMDLSLTSAVFNAIFGSRAKEAKTLINEFHYPVLGPGMMWERFQELVEAEGGQVHLNCEVTGIRHDGSHVTEVVAREGEQTAIYPGQHFISSMPVTDLIARLEPPPPPEVLQAARQLKYRAFIIVVLIVQHPDLFRDNWIYVHDAEVKVGRIQNFKNWSAALVPTPGKSSLGMEYFCTQGDSIWTMANDDLIALATRELADLGLAEAISVEDGVVIRQPAAYPVYDREYRQHLAVIRRFLATLQNLQTIGRNGMHRYNNQDHSMLAAMLAVKNLLGEDHDLWSVNTERSYYEEVLVRKTDPARLKC
jgi:protoporphyrinogen oxidase